MKAAGNWWPLALGTRLSTLDPMLTTSSNSECLSVAFSKSSRRTVEIWAKQDH